MRMLCVIAIFLFTSSAWADIYVVMAKQSTSEALTKKNVMAIYTGKTKALPNGNLATVFDYTDSATIKTTFYKTLTNRSVSQINSYWARLVFAGRHVPPTQVKTEADMVERIAKDPNAIGYVSEVNSDQVKVVYTIK